MRRVIVALFAVVLVGASATVSTAGAAWAPGSSASGRATARSIGAPTSVTATALSSSSVRVDWAAPTGGSVTPTQYVVVRTAPTVATVCTVGPPTVTCTDSGLAASTSYSYTVTSRVGTNWVSPASSTASATTPATPTFNLSVPVGNQTAGTAFAVTITATTNGTTTDTAYTGVKTITFSGPGNAPSETAPTYPATVTFTAGIGTASLTLVKAESPTLAATDGTRSGSVLLTVVAGAAAKLGWTGSSVSCASGSVTVGNGGSFTSKVTAYDSWLNPVVGARTVNLTKSQPTGTLNPTSLTILAAASETSASSTFTLPNGNPPATTVTAGSAGLTSVSCTVNK